MKAKNIISPLPNPNDYSDSLVVSPETPLAELLEAIRLSPGGVLKVADGEKVVGIIDMSSLLGAMSTYYLGGDDCAYIEAECPAGDYSASLVSRAVEDADAHLYGLWTRSDREGRMRMSLKVGRSDPMPVAHSLERYDFKVTDWYVPGEKEYQLSGKALDALKLYLKV